MINILRKKLPEPELKEIFDNLLQQAMMMNGTKAGSLQMINTHDHSLEIVSSFGLSDEFIEHFKKVTINDGSICSRALQTGESVFIGDITQDKQFARHLFVTMANNINSIQSTPLICSNGRLIGMISTHSNITRNPSKISLAKFESFCRDAADKIEEFIK
ncbi:MAG TPA: GAF domain-containing protein [Chitinophagaceae bacterium]|nr:GAF domain-containing protein [Chitinophagaceae bacterium]